MFVMPTEIVLVRMGMVLTAILIAESLCYFLGGSGVENLSRVLFGGGGQVRWCIRGLTALITIAGLMVMRPVKHRSCDRIRRVGDPPFMGESRQGPDQAEDGLVPSGKDHPPSPRRRRTRVGSNSRPVWKSWWG